jgi:hypothetical protein
MDPSAPSTHAVADPHLALPPIPPLLLQLAQFHTTFNPDADYRRVQAARQRVARFAATLKMQLAALEEETLAL